MIPGGNDPGGNYAFRKSLAKGLMEAKTDGGGTTN